MPAPMLDYVLISVKDYQLISILEIKKKERKTIHSNTCLLKEYNNLSTKKLKNSHNLNLIKRKIFS